MSGTEPESLVPTGVEAGRAANLLREKGPFVLTALLIIGFFLVWQWLTGSGLIHRIIVPTPEVVATQIVEVIKRPSFFENFWVTVREVLIGFAVGSVAAISTALLNERFPLVKRVLTPYIVAVQAVPKVILLPILAVWFGLGPTSATIVVALIAFFPVYINTITGLSLSAEDGLRLLHSLGASRRQAFRMYRMPVAMPLIFTGLKTAVNYSILGAISAEFLGAESGLGYLVVGASTDLRIPDVYATVAIISVFAAAVYFLLEYLDRRVIYWRETTDNGGNAPG